MAVGGSLSVSERRLVFGLNTLVQGVLALLVLGFIVSAVARLGGRWDLSTRGVNSLSQRTQALLAGLDQDVQITALYTLALAELNRFDESRFNRVRDLLDLYETAGRGRVSTAMLDPQKNEAAVRALIERLQKKPRFADETAPHQKLLTTRDALREKILALALAESQALEGIIKSDPRIATLPQATIFRLGFQNIAKDATETEKDIKQFLTGDTPRYEQAARSLQEHADAVLRSLQEMQNWMKAEGVSVPGIAPATAEYFRGAAERYEPLISELSTLTQQLNELKPVALEQLFNDLISGQTILVETADGADVLTLSEVWPERQAEQRVADQDPREFAGERAISSALLKLTQKERTGVLFVRAGGSPLTEMDFATFNPMMGGMPPEPPYSELRRALESENFVVAEWDVAQQPTPPVLEQVARTVFLLTPPSPPPQNNPMMPPPAGMTPEQSLAVQTAVEESGRAIVMVAHQLPGEPANPYVDLLRSWDVRAQTNYLAMEYAPTAQDKDRWWPANRDLPGVPGLPLLTTKVMEFTDHPIARDLRSAPGALYLVCPLEIAPAAAPATQSQPATPSTAVEVVARVRNTESVWATDNFMRVYNEDLRRDRGTFRRETDLPAPFPVILASTRSDGRKLVVFGSDRFAQDAIAQAVFFDLSVGSIVQWYPANTDLIINSVHWLAGEVDRISVGPSRGDAPRLDKLQPGAATTFVQAFIVGIWPAAILLLGGGVWLMRRR